MTDPMDVVLYVIGPIGILLAAYGIYLTEKLKRLERRRESLVSDVAHHPAE